MNPLPDMELDGGLALLIQKIRLLRRRLVSYGYSACQVNDIIFDGFLNVPCQMDWLQLGNTTLLYKLKDSLNLEASEGELVMCLLKYFGQHQTEQIPEFFLDVIHNNSMMFGIDLNNSSSDSNESEGSLLRRRHLEHASRKGKATTSERSKSSPKRARQHHQPEDPPRKKPRIEQTKSLKRELDNRQVLDEEKPEKKQKKQ